MTFQVGRRSRILPTWREQILAHPDKAMRERLLALDDERIAEMAKLKELRAQEKRNAPPKRKVPQQPPVTRKRSATIKAWVEMQWEHQHEQQRGRDQEAKRKRRPRPNSVTRAPEARVFGTIVVDGVKNDFTKQCGDRMSETLLEGVVFASRSTASTTRAHRRYRHDDRDTDADSTRKQSDSSIRIDKRTGT
jgi:hypothetical protein